MVSFFSFSARSASVSECNLQSMRPYIMSGLREYAASFLHENHIDAHPMDSIVTYKGSVEVPEEGGLVKEDAFEVSVEPKNGDRYLAYTSLLENQKWIVIPEPVVKKSLDDSTPSRGPICVASMSLKKARSTIFENQANPKVALKDVLTADDSMLAWVAIVK